MADIRKLDEQRKKDRRAGLVGLAAAEGNGAPAECLSSEELGDVAAGVCSPEQKEKALAHFAECQKCYDAWVAICFAIASVHRGEPRSRRFTLTMRNLTYLGSAFAIAASVVVFLNLKGVQQEVLIAPPGAERQVESEELSADTVAGAGRPAPAPAMKSVTADSQERVEAEATIQTSMVIEPAPEPVDDRAEILGWLNLVGKLCPDDGAAVGITQFSTVYEQGRSLDLSSMTTADQDNIARLLMLLDPATGEEGSDRCGQIRELLAKELNWE